VRQKNPGKPWSTGSNPPGGKRGFERTINQMVLSDDDTFETLEDDFRNTRVEYKTLNED
jgi:hypothetical protein